MNNKIKTEIALGIIVLVVLVVGGIFWMQGEDISQTQTQTPLQSIQQPQKMVAENNYRSTKQ